MILTNRITSDPEVLGGKPVIQGSRLSVEFILDLLAAGETEADMIENYPGLSHEDISACLSYASQVVHDFRVYPLSA